MGFPCGSACKESTCSVGDLGLIPGLGRSPGEGEGYPLQFLAWRIPWTIVLGVKKSGKRLSNFHFQSPMCDWDFPGGTSGKEPACQCRRHKRCRFDPWVRKIPCNPIQHSCLENPMDRGAWQGTVHGVSKSWT